MRNCNPLRKPNSLPRSCGSEAVRNKSISLPFNSVLMVRDERQSHPAPTTRRCFTAIAHPASLRSSEAAGQRFSVADCDCPIRYFDKLRYRNPARIAPSQNRFDMTFAPQRNGGLHREDGQRTTMRAICRSCTIFFSNSGIHAVESGAHHHTTRFEYSRRRVQISSRNSARTKIQRRPSLLFQLTGIPFCQRQRPRRGRFRFITNLRLCTMLKNSGYLDQK
jgi:hypothetical protein